jgi:hypothetical protein
MLSKLYFRIVPVVYDLLRLHLGHEFDQQLSGSRLECAGSSVSLDGQPFVIVVPFQNSPGEFATKILL